jgi:hypothetical protein
VGFEILTSVVMKRCLLATDVSEEHVASIFSTQRFLVACFMLDSCLAYSSTLKNESKCFSETPVHFQLITCPYITEDRTLQGERLS